MDGGKEESFVQKVLENNWLLLAIGLVFPGVFYFGWGLIEIFVINAMPLSEYLKKVGGF